MGVNPLPLCSDLKDNLDLFPCSDFSCIENNNNNNNNKYNKYDNSNTTTNDDDNNNDNNGQGPGFLNRVV